MLRANQKREHKAHLVVFFIFVVSNCGGLLTPLGDPPLFLGFLKGVPFAWTFQLWREWLFVNGALLATFAVWDRRALKRDEQAGQGPRNEDLQRHEPFGINGRRNLALLGAIVAIVYASGRGLGNHGAPWPFGAQEGAMLAVAAASWAITNREIHRVNHFSFGIRSSKLQCYSPASSSR